MNILERYGIKEVADVTFYKINDDGSPAYPVLYLDTLKVTTIEQTAEETEARGGKGNAALIAWDYGKSINVTIEDALFSAKSMAIMFGNGSVQTYSGGEAYIMKTEQWTATATTSGNSPTSAGWSANYVGPDSKLYAKQNQKFFDAMGQATTSFTEGETYFCSYDLLVDGAIIDISANSFPGTYYVTGDTFARSEATGDDEFFQFIIPKAKVQSENTITLEAEGDPSVFNMNLKVLRPADGVMMKLVKYDLVDGNTGEGLTSTIYHNHYLDPASSVGAYVVDEGSNLILDKPVGAGNVAASAITWKSTDTQVASVGETLTTGEHIGGVVVTGQTVSEDTHVVIIATWDPATTGTSGYAVYDIIVRNT